MLSDTVDRVSIDKMIHKFYAEIIKDDVVGPYFIKALGSNLKNEKWYEHFWTLNNFWLKMMTGKGSYGGDPFFAHAFIGELYPETYDRWLEIFDKTVHEFYTPDIAEKFYKKGEIVAAQFKERFADDDEDDF